MAILNSDQFTANIILAIWGISNAYCVTSTGSKAALADAWGLARTQITSNVSNYWYYSNGYVYMKRPNSTYSFDSHNYRIFCVR